MSSWLLFIQVAALVWKWPGSCARSLPEATSHSRTEVRSVETMALPSGDHSARSIGSSWPVKRCAVDCVVTSHSRIVRSSLSDSSPLGLVGDQLRRLMVDVWPLRV